MPDCIRGGKGVLGEGVLVEPNQQSGQVQKIVRAAVDPEAKRVGFGHHI
ncbi:MAG: hypothetical protein V1754_03165 [Pseudomonadota bacterium]